MKLEVTFQQFNLLLAAAEVYLYNLPRDGRDRISDLITYLHEREKEHKNED